MCRPSKSLIKHYVFHNTVFHVLSGKVYYDMKHMRVESENDSKIALCRIEQVSESINKWSSAHVNE